MRQTPEKAPRHFFCETVMSRLLVPFSYRFALGAGTRRSSCRIAKTHEKPGFFANETHSQVEIVCLTDASSAAT
jgi:hypothetical protein